MNDAQRALIPPHLSPDEALATLIAEHGTFVYAVCLGMCGDGERARDLAQETFLRAYRSWDGFEGRAKASTWLYTIARRTCLRRLRPRAGEPREHDDLEPIGDRVPATAAVPEVDYASTDPLQALIDDETAALVRDAIARLPIRYRLPLVLKEIAGLSVAEVARVLHMSEGTVKSRLFRARAGLAPELELVRAPESGSRAGRGPGAPDTTRARDAGDRSRAETLCPSCRTVFGSDERACRACDELLDGDPSPELGALIRRELARS